MNAPSGYRIEAALSAWQSTRARLIADDPSLANDEGGGIDELLGPEAGDVKDILSRLLTAVQHAEAMADGAAEMITNIQARQKRYKARAEQFRGTIFAILDAIGERKAEFPHGTISIGKARDVALITDEAAVPDEYATEVTTRKIDKAAVLADLKQGVVIEGATLTNGMPTLTIRSR